MTDRELLIELLKGAETKVVERLSAPLALEEWLAIYADYLLANGAIVPPCKVGDKVYYISAVGNIVENEITHIGSYCKGEYYDEQHGIKVPLFTSTFLLDTDEHYRSYEEAEKALAERIGK